MHDPKIDPRPGDRVRGKSGMVRTVVRVDFPDAPHPKVIFTAERNGAAPTRKGEWLRDWRRWCERNSV